VNINEAKRYLARVLPWPTDGGDWFVNLHTLRDVGRRDKKGKPILMPGGRPFKDVGRAANAIEWWLTKSQHNTDIYACMSAQATAVTRYDDNGKAFLTAVRNTQNTLWCKSLYIDVDVKAPPKGYATREEALEAINAFIEALGMPEPSVIVDSGNGFHVYWTVVDPVTPAQWWPYAYALAEATKAFGLRCDTQCTVDVVRILRVPGTYNYKSDPPTTVSIHHWRDGDYFWKHLTGPLEPYVGRVVIETDMSQEFAALGRMSGPMVANELGSGIEPNKAPEVDLAKVINDCAFFRDTVVDGGAKNDNPLWVLTLLAATFCGEDGAELAQAMSAGHETYDPDTVATRYAEKLAEKTRRNLGWPSCKAISGAGAPQCSTCPHLAAGKSPMRFGMPDDVTLASNTPPPRPVPAAVQALSQQTGIYQIAMNTLPDDYVRRPNGIIAQVVTPSDGGAQFEQAVCPYPLFDGWLQRDPWTINFSTVVSGGKQERVAVRYEDMSGSETFRKTVLRFGLAFDSEKTFERLKVFLMAWINKLRDGPLAIGSGHTFGWSTNGTKEDGFIYDGHLYGMDPEPRPMAIADPVIAEQYRPRADIGPWVDALDIVLGRERYDLEAIVASAFAAPLVKFTGHSGLIMAAYSEASGVGKTTAMKIAQAVWGDPKRAMQQLDDTQNSVFKKIGQIKNLPMYWDEIKGEENLKNYVRMIFSMASGKEKSRMRADATMNLSGTWKTLLVSANNESLIDYIIRQTKQTSAGLMRVFEYPVVSRSDGSMKTSSVQASLGLLDENYGQAGLIYAKWLGANWERVAKDVLAMSSAFEKRAKATTDERFWIALIAVLVLGATYANKLGLAQFNTAKLREFLFEQLEAMRGVGDAQPVDMSKGINVVNVLSRFLAQKRARNTLITNRMHVSRGKPPAGINTLNEATKLDEIQVHMSVDDKLLRIVSSAFSDWCQEHGISRHQFTKALHDQFNVHETVGIIGAGTPYKSMAQYVIQLDLADLKIQPFMDT